MTHDTNYIQTSVKKYPNYLAVSNNFANKQIVSWVYIRLFRKFFGLLALKQNIILPIFVGSIWCLSHATFIFINTR
ncbi:hypothetical protein AWB57_02595 [Riemerella anatipestifer]|nr:hypothetical protein AWB57_02595 [Riemerella anatipestifer]MDD1538362.1 hypothetical protein [Riemerella anatipestifer]MRM85894.1 hypothetical protein [Riemerella anatipestifer]MRM94085.1 hypothetical protein [Riemerella anatipestifer]MRQ21905.1 hypothetical protein [Riemerella anatipestifer]